ncbi:HAD family phosphatase [Patescibacteria group bacterium]|nr:HAD family phosphatase [Patescibacteria group bacterium]
MIKAIIFDLAETLIQGIVGVDEYLGEILQIEIKHENLHIDELEKLFLGKISEDSYWEAMIKTHGWNTSLDKLKQAVRNNFREITGTREIIEKLKQNGYKIGLLSIHAKEWVEYLDKIYDYHKLFNAVSYSYIEGVSKPDKAAYEIILKRLRAKPDESIFIDDNPRFVKTAEDIGIKSIVFKNPQQLRKDLIKLNIKLQN